MCKYCDTSYIDVQYSCSDYFVHRPFYLRNDYNGKRIKADRNNPIMYLREYSKSNTWSLICEFADEEGTVIETPIIYCPRCGNKLVRKKYKINNKKN